MNSNTVCCDSVATLKAEMQDVLTRNILPFWLDKMQDQEHGGFYGRMDGHMQLHPEAEKGAILNARILWSFSAAYRVLSEKLRMKSEESATATPSPNAMAAANSSLFTLHSSLLEAATRAKDYILDHFIDPEYGGVYWSLDYKGQPLDTKKQFYAIGFAIYGLSEYARATGDREALDYALQLFDCIEEHAFDHEHNGYIEATTRDWQPIADMRLSDLDANYPKSQNTHLHIIEPYTNLYRCLKEFQASSSCSYVPAIGSILPIDISVPLETIIRVEAALRNLIDIFTDRILNPDTHHVDDDLHWWVQAENVVGWANLYQHFGDEDALQKALRGWDYIKRNLIDYEHGEWYWSRRPDGSLNLDDDHAGFWKCPYHNSRMCLEIIERFS